MNDENTSQRPYDLDRVVRMVLGTGLVIGLFLLVRYLSDVLIPFAIAVLIAYLINPIVTALERKIKSRPAATLITVFGFLIIAASLVTIVVPKVTAEIASFGEVIEQFRAEAEPLPNAKTIRARFRAYVGAQDSELFKQFLLELKNVIAGIDYDSLKQQAVGHVAPGVWSLVTGALSFLLGLTGLIIILLYTIFLSIDYTKFAGAWRNYLPPKHRDRILGFVDEFLRAMSRYFRGQFIIASTVGVLFATGFGLIGLRMGIVLGLGIGMLNMVPYLQTVGLIPALLLGIMRAIEGGTSVGWSLLLVLLVFVTVQLIQDALLVPLIMGKQTGLRPAALLLGIFIWGKLLGFLGLILAIPLTCLAVAWYRRAVLGQLDAEAIPKKPDT
jgi:predicted PurR-regulated permease PerM